MTQVIVSVEDVQCTNPNKLIKLVKISGQLDESNVDEEAKKIYSLIDSSGSNLNLIFEFSGLEYMNSKSIGYLTDWYSKITANGGKLAICAARENILDILQVVGLTQLITTYASLDEAKLAVMQ